MQKKIFLFISVLTSSVVFSNPPAAPAPAPAAPAAPVLTAPTPAPAPAQPQPSDDLFVPSSAKGGNANLEQRMDAMESVFSDICKRFSKEEGPSGMGAAEPHAPGVANPQPA
ncbi:hypothetical protein P618_200381 [Holospora obtusa F1]|uniref:Uncharacterized protein n=1 Tax=Holospora obtusa F1 TaxID=1399147 RepID=W6TE61_HOLOB|nr:hypothetical protein [Holospora obtusa]ETZ07433.1 hypothetical protein P618_200381 [Holospora obtusa F1]